MSLLVQSFTSSLLQQCGDYLICSRSRGGIGYRGARPLWNACFPVALLPRPTCCSCRKEVNVNCTLCGSSLRASLTCTLNSFLTFCLDSLMQTIHWLKRKLSKWIQRTKLSEFQLLHFSDKIGYIQDGMDILLVWLGLFKGFFLSMTGKWFENLT